jgi:hypothetical protein
MLCQPAKLAQHAFLAKWVFTALGCCFPVRE